jgi:Ankyrin repeats (3 copies)
MAAERGHVPAVNALLAAGASLTAKTPQGNTALHCAATQGRWGAVRALLSAAATAAAAVSGSSSSSAESSRTVAAAGVKNRQGLTAVQVALKKGLAVPADVLELVGVADSSGSSSSGAGGSSSSISSSSGGDSTLLFHHELCTQHRSCPPITRSGPEPPPENVKRLEVRACLLRNVTE